VVHVHLWVLRQLPAAGNKRHRNKWALRFCHRRWKTAAAAAANGPGRKKRVGGHDDDDNK